MSVVINNLFFISNQLAALGTTCKVGVWHTMTELAGKSLSVAGVSLILAPLRMTGKVGVWHAMTQNWQVRLLMTANQRSLGGRSRNGLYKYMDK